VVSGSDVTTNGRSGTLIWLVGGPSVGKSSVARAIQAAGGVRDSWVLAGDHHLLRAIAADQLVRHGHPVDYRWDGWTVPFLDGRVVGRPRAGRRALRIMDGMYRAAVAMTRAGNNVVVEDVVWEASVAALARQSFSAVGPFVVRLRCPESVAIERERTRADRFVGAVAAYSREPELISDVDLSLDTSVLDPRAIADQVLEALDTRTAQPTSDTDGR
jgi:chloramphenicol 3-O-phosphotransferase